MAPMPTPVLTSAVAPMRSCLRVKRANALVSVGFGVGGSGSGAATGGGATLAGGFGASVRGAGVAAGEGVATGEGLVVGKGEEVDEDTTTGAGVVGAERGNAGLAGISTAIGSVIRDPLKNYPSEILSATRSFALRARGLRTISASDASTGFLFTSRQIPIARNACFTRRSSSE